jgi:hypothetical protein
MAIYLYASGLRASIGCVIYAAKSTEDRRGSISEQLADCRPANRVRVLCWRPLVHLLIAHGLKDRACRGLDRPGEIFGGTLRTQYLSLPIALGAMLALVRFIEMHHDCGYFGNMVGRASWCKDNNCADR